MEKKMDTFQTRTEFSLENRIYSYYSLKKLAERLQIDLQKLPISIKILLENMLRRSSVAELDDPLLGHCGNCRSGQGDGRNQ